MITDLMFFFTPYPTNKFKNINSILLFGHPLLPRLPWYDNKNKNKIMDVKKGTRYLGRYLQTLSNLEDFDTTLLYPLTIRW